MEGIVKGLVPRADSVKTVTDSVEKAIQDPRMSREEFDKLLSGGRGILEPKGVAATTQNGRLDAAWRTIQELRADRLKQLELEGLKATQVLPGTNGKVAVIGRSMGDVKQGREVGVVDYARKLRDEHGYDTELFAGPLIPQSAKDEIDALRAKHGTYILPDDVIQKTEMYRFNREWAEKLKKEGYTVIDLGDPHSKGASPFYDMERKIVFGK